VALQICRLFRTYFPIDNMPNCADSHSRSAFTFKATHQSPLEMWGEQISETFSETAQISGLRFKD
jgi:hypothetical protein